ncbi:MAG: flagellar hook protein FlgE [Spirochaetales bacterium]|jgi:flagellar hook protein FlgE|nr:flagellar hook protein FlgE [Spirochaetales bacterium]
MGSSLFAGISGLASAGKQLDVIGNNIANVNTVGFKAGKIHFGDILSQSVTGGSAAGMQVGRGVDVAAITTQFSSGSFETTANATDLAIDGDGFFIVKDDDGGEYYTRAGAFHLDNEGYLVDVNSLKVQGYNLAGSDPDTIADISLSGVQSEPSASTEISIGANLDGATVAGETFNASQTVYDSLGTVHSLKLNFQKTEGIGYWGFKSYLDNTAATAQTYSGLKFDTDGVLNKVYSSSIGTPTITTAFDGAATATVNNQGQLYQDSTEITLTRRDDEDTWAITADGGYTSMSLTLGTADADDSVAIDLDGTGGADITFALSDTWANADTIKFTITQTEATPADVNLTMPTITGATIGASGVVAWDLAGTTAEAITGYASTSVIRTLVHDGYSSGSLKSISVTSDGTLSGFFTNGQTSDISQIVLADFANVTGLKRMGKNLFGTTVESGDAVPNKPGAGGMGEISPNSLEMSNTDIATEFINMITAQRAYQASAKIVTVTDQMMAELMNIKR